MIILRKPLLEVKGYYVFKEGQPLDTTLYRMKDFPHLYGENKSNRVVFSYTPIAREGVYEYGATVIAGNWQNELNRFSVHYAKGEEAMHVWGNSTIMTFDFDKRDGVIVKEAHTTHNDCFELNGHVSIFNRDVVNDVWLVKIRLPLKNTDVFEKHKGEPIIYRWNEKSRNYNYLVWRRDDLKEKSCGGFLEGLEKALRKSF